MDIIQCPYNKYLTEQGCPELNVLFCENDVYTYGSLLGMKYICPFRNDESLHGSAYQEEIHREK